MRSTRAHILRPRDGPRPNSGTLGSLLFGGDAAVAWGAILVAMGVAAAAQGFSTAARLTSLDIGASRFPESYVMSSRTDPGRCHLVDRRASTVRRSRKGLAGKRWDIHRAPSLGAESGRDLLLLRSKRLGTALFLPSEAVEDLAFPLLYGFVRWKVPELKLPAAYWTQLYVDRTYQGLYLRVHLPVDPRKKDGGSGVLRELLEVAGGQATIIDTRFDRFSRHFSNHIALGLFPEVPAPHPFLAWLDSMRSGTGEVFLLSNDLPGQLSPLPLPIPLSRVLARFSDEGLRYFQDERFLQLQGSQSGAGAAGIPAALDEVARRRLRRDYQVYRRRLRLALATEASVWTLPARTVPTIEAVSKAWGL